MDFTPNSDNLRNIISPPNGININESRIAGITINENIGIAKKFPIIL